jgi:hypothetical protein
MEDAAMNRSRISQLTLGEPLRGTVVNKHCPGQGETDYHTLTLRREDSSIVKVIVQPSAWKQLSLGDTYVIP